MFQKIFRGQSPEKFQKIPTKFPNDSIIDQFVHFPAADVKKIAVKAFQLFCYMEKIDIVRAAAIKKSYLPVK